LIKIIFDRVFAAVLLFVLVPFGLVLFLGATFLGHRRNLIFTQTRIGKNNRPFTLYKLKTMTDATDNNGKLLSDAKRLTTWGKFLRKTSLDEVPQVINVLKGDMSFVGPRPLLPHYVPLYSERQARRHEVKPGITGWAQVNGRNAITWEEKFELDVFYVENQSLFLDLKTLIRTVSNVIGRKGISGEGTVSMKPFMGSGDCKSSTLESKG
jgi:lipopolysaccharide/colanic/teichoic acid biosynthesis glycosyltransferase